jgi:hypothetical protein
MFGKTNISSKLSVNYSNFTLLNDFVLICACLVGGAGKYSEGPYQNTSKVIKMDEKKIYQVTYKVYHNERIKKVPFHGKLVYPLYIRLTFDRRSTEYKSNMFDLFMKPKYGIRVSGQVYAPSIEKIIQREEKLIEFVIDRHPDDFSLEVSKQEYDYYSRDLLDEMEPGFGNYLQTFFEDEGMPNLGDVLANSRWKVSLYEVIRDLKMALKPDLFQRLIDHTFHYAPPYFPLHQFIETPLRPPLAVLTVMDWESADTKERFTEFMKRNYPDKDLAGIFAAIGNYMKRLRNA